MTYHCPYNKGKKEGRQATTAESVLAQTIHAQMLYIMFIEFEFHTT